MNLNIHWMPTNQLNATQIRPCASWAQQSLQSMLCTSNLKKQSRHQQLDVDAKQQQHLASLKCFFFLPCLGSSVV